LRKGALGGGRTREGVGGTLADRERTLNALLHLERTGERTLNALLHLQRTVNKRPSALGGDRVIIELTHLTIRRPRVVRTHVREAYRRARSDRAAASRGRVRPLTGTFHPTQRRPDRVHQVKHLGLLSILKTKTRRGQPFRAEGGKRPYAPLGAAPFRGLSPVPASGMHKLGACSSAQPAPMRIDQTTRDYFESGDAALSYAEEAARGHIRAPGSERRAELRQAVGKTPLRSFEGIHDDRWPIHGTSFARAHRAKSD
jgi:hypothetical protein